MWKRGNLQDVIVVDELLFSVFASSFPNIEAHAKTASRIRDERVTCLASARASSVYDEGSISSLLHLAVFSAQARLEVLRWRSQTVAFAYSSPHCCAMAHAAYRRCHRATGVRFPAALTLNG